MTDVRTETCRQVLRITCHQQRASADTLRRIRERLQKRVGPPGRRNQESTELEGHRRSEGIESRSG